MSDTKSSPAIAHRKGFYHEVTAGKRYLGCSCGRSKTQPFCDSGIYPGDNPSINY